MTVGAGRYWILVPLALLEGPTVALVTGGLASRGDINIWVAYGLFVAKDLAVDGTFYVCGRGIARGMLPAALRRIHVTPRELELVRAMWYERGWRTMVIGKLAWGLSPLVLGIAGLVALPPGRFFLYASGVALLQYAVLLALGYSLGQAPAIVSNAARATQYLATVVVLIGFFYLRRRLRLW